MVITLSPISQVNRRCLAPTQSNRIYHMKRCLDGRAAETDGRNADGFESWPERGIGERDAGPTGGYGGSGRWRRGKKRILFGQLKRGPFLKDQAQVHSAVSGRCHASDSSTNDANIGIHILIERRYCCLLRCRGPERYAFFRNGKSLR
jgi:hypothetical protein